MAKLTKEEYKILKKLRESGIYPDLTNSLEDRIIEAGVEGLDYKKNKEKLARERTLAEQRFQEGSARPETAARGRDIGETAAGGMLGDALGYLIPAMKGTAKLGADIAQKGVKKAIKETIQGTKPTYEQRPSESPEELAYREKIRELGLPLLTKILRGEPLDEWDRFLQHNLAADINQGFNLLGQGVRGGIQGAQQGLNYAGQGLSSLGRAAMGGVQRANQMFSRAVDPFASRAVGYQNNIQDLLSNLSQGAQGVRRNIFGGGQQQMPTRNQRSASYEEGLKDILNNLNV